MTRTSEQYIEDPHRCPVCGSRSIEGTSGMDVIAGSIRQSVWCKDCGADWVDTYGLVGYEGLTAPRKGMVPALIPELTHTQRQYLYDTLACLVEWSTDQLPADEHPVWDMARRMADLLRKMGYTRTVRLSDIKRKASNGN